MHQIVIPLDILGAILILWSIPWKIYAVWMSVKSDRKKWFVALIFINTFSILEMIYIFKIEKKQWMEVEEAFQHGWKLVRHIKKEDFKS